MKAIITLYTSIPDNNGADKRVLAGDFELQDNGNLTAQTLIGLATLKPEDVQMSVELAEGVELENLPAHIWLIN